MGSHYPGNAGRRPNPPVQGPRIGAAVGAVLLLAGCGGGDRVHQAPPAARHWGNVAPADPAAANSVLMRAISLVGTPYRYGGNTPEGGFDCSGLVHYVFRDMLELRLPRTSRDLARYQGPPTAPEVPQSVP